MQSVKNTAVSIILLFLSYGVYQVITKPLPSEVSQFDSSPMSVIDSVDENMAVAENLNLPPALPAQDNDSGIPPELLELDLPESKSFAEVPNSNQFAESDSVSTQDLPEATNNENQFKLFSNAEPTKSSLVANNDQDFLSQPKTLDAKNKTISYEVPGNDLSTDQFDSDSQIIPSTVMANVAQKPNDTISREGQSVSTRPRTLSETWPTIEQMVNQAQFQDALFELSTFYRDGNFNAAESSQLMDWLDALAAKVIYSAEHHIQSRPYIIQPGDTIGSLARKWQIPAQLIYNVNSRNIPDPTNLQPGVDIKMIEGPFDAEIDSQQGVMTLFLNEMYAGRFEIKTGSSVQVGSVRITDKSAQDQLDRPFWIALSNGGSIYATEEAPQNPNELGMSLREAEEIFSILSATSKIRILR